MVWFGQLNVLEHLGGITIRIDVGTLRQILKSIEGPTALFLCNRLYCNTD